MHIGNYHDDTLGCLLPGCSYSLSNGEYAVWSSGTKMNQLRELLGSSGATITITDINSSTFWGW